MNECSCVCVCVCVRVSVCACECVRACICEFACFAIGLKTKTIVSMDVMITRACVCTRCVAFPFPVNIGLACKSAFKLLSAPGHQPPDV